jgi:hypothetical protein
MTHILHRHTGHKYPIAANGQGAIIRDGAGKEYIGASSGAGLARQFDNPPTRHASSCVLLYLWAT